ncbi:MAG: TROVE domain-containing protein [Planctomycetota bacterium]|nr:TROVE domain-containing protein [Planctomycetota bacterium]
MARVGFTKSTKVSATKRDDAIFNKQGGIGHRIDDPTQKLLAMVGSYLGEPGFFPDKEPSKLSLKSYNVMVLDQRGRELFEAALEVAQGAHPEDVLVIAHWARQELNMRLAPQLLFVAAARSIRVSNEASPLIRYLPKIASRPDDLLQVLALYNCLFGQRKVGAKFPKAKLPSCLKRAMAQTMANYSDYQLLKYNNRSQHPNWADALGALRGGRLVPKAKRKADGHFPFSQGMKDYLVDGKVSVASPVAVKARYDFFRLAKDHPLNEEVDVMMKAGRLTWENFVSHFGQTEDPERLKAVWQRAFQLMPYMAKLRNLRNGMTAKVPDLEKIAQSLADPKAVLKGKQLPFRYFSAARALTALKTNPKAVKKVVKILDEALEVSVANLPTFQGRTAIFVDCSGSMSWKPISKDSTLYPMDVACLLGALMKRVSNDGHALAFATTVKPVAIQPHLGVMEMARKIRMAGRNCGGGTNIAGCIEYLREKSIKVDRILMLSDMQPGVGGAVGDALRKYRSQFGACFYHSIDLQAHGQSTVPANDPGVHLLSGFSEKIVQLIANFETKLEPKVEAANVLPDLIDLRTRFSIGTQSAA